MEHQEIPLDEEELRSLGVPEDLIEEARKRAQRGIPPLQPSPDLLERVMRRCAPHLKKTIDPSS